ncbi:hypothetical protein MRB53_040715 [Persea americana]|nr:hypothetical protein MRB53_040715 [Persea americana]
MKPISRPQPHRRRRTACFDNNTSNEVSQPDFDIDQLLQQFPVDWQTVDGGAFGRQTLPDDWTTLWPPDAIEEETRQIVQNSISSSSYDPASYTADSAYLANAGGLPILWPPHEDPPALFSRELSAVSTRLYPVHQVMISFLQLQPRYAGPLLSSGILRLHGRAAQRRNTPAAISSNFEKMSHVLRAL